MRRTTAVVVLALAALGVLSGCATTAPAGNVTLPNTTAAATQHTTSGPDGSAAHPLPFGATYSNDQLALKIEAPVSYTPSPSAFVDGSPAHTYTVQVTVTNKGNQALSPGIDVNLDATAGNDPADDIEDSTNGVGTPTNNVLPGRTFKWLQGFGVVKGAKDLTITVQLGFGANPIYYTGDLPK